MQQKMIENLTSHRYRAKKKDKGLLRVSTRDQATREAAWRRCSTGIGDIPCDAGRVAAPETLETSSDKRFGEKGSDAAEMLDGDGDHSSDSGRTTERANQHTPEAATRRRFDGK
jgi:hypothetical protein